MRRGQENVSVWLAACAYLAAREEEEIAAYCSEEEKREADKGKDRYPLLATLDALRGDPRGHHELRGAEGGA